jgi:Protein of unknown function (DUF4038)/Putative collagen-binding domain of a collagenase
MNFIKSTIAAIVLTCIVALFASAQIRVSENNRFLTTKEGKPFFWLGDTDWELFHRLTREEAEEFLEIRKQQGFNVIQAVALAEVNGIREPNRYGDWPLNNEDPTQLAITPGDQPKSQYEYDYWDHVNFVINKAAEKGMYIGLLPTWGDKLAHMWGDGPIIFNEQNAEVYAVTLAKRYAKQWNVIWVLGGDRPAVYSWKVKDEEKKYDDRPLWRAMARGIESVLGKEAFITYHPAGGPNSTSQYIQEESWLDMNAFQSGHGSREADAWNWVMRDLSYKPQKPTLDMEPCYEDHPVNPWDGKWTKQRGYFTAYDVRARIYRGIFAGACGVTYGHHQIWQFMNKELYEPVNVGDTIIPWRKAARAEAADQMRHLKNLILSRPYETRISDQSLIKSEVGKTYVDLIYTTRNEDGAYAMIYLPQNKPVSIDVSKISGSMKNAWWFDPRTGKSTPIKSIKGKSTQLFTPPTEGKDWVLVIDDASKNFLTPGTK